MAEKTFQKLWITFLKDMKLSFNGIYFYIEVGMAVIFTLVMVFVVPENFDSSQTFHVVLDAEPAYQSFLRNLFESEDLGQIQFHDDRHALYQAMEADRSSVGVVLSMDAQGLQYNLVLQGYESPRMRTLLKTLIEGELLSQAPGWSGTTDTRVLEPDSERLTDRAHVLPIYLTVNVGLMGLFIIAAYIFLDKDEGVIKAFAVAPVHIWQYLASKLCIMLIIGLGSSLLVVFALVGRQAHYGLLLGATVAFNLFGSTLGLFIASFFDTMVKAMGALYLAVMVLMIASVSYFMPSFNPLWIRIFPSYPMLFSFRELLLSNGNAWYVLQNIGFFLILSGVLFGLSVHRFKRSITV